VVHTTATEAPAGRSAGHRDPRCLIWWSRQGEQDYAVLGCGITGLASARILQWRGKNVTIYAKDMPPRVTSNYAGAGWSPTATLCDPAKISDEFKVVFERRRASRTGIGRISSAFTRSTAFIYTHGIQLRSKPNPNPLPRISTAMWFQTSTPSRLNSLPTSILSRFRSRPRHQHALRDERVLSNTINDFFKSGGKLVIVNSQRWRTSTPFPRRR